MFVPESHPQEILLYVANIPNTSGKEYSTWTDIGSNVVEAWKHAKWKKPVTEYYMLCESIYHRSSLL